MSLSFLATRSAKRASRRGAVGDVAPVARPGASETGLDWFTFFCANLQTGFGPFVAAYLTSAKWTQTDIGLVLMIGGLVGLFGQIPGGALVDRTQRKVAIAGLAVALIGVAAMLVALSSVFLVILAAWILHAFASCVLTPSIATISLGLVGHERISARLGRNATFASVGSALAAAGMGVCGDYISNKAVFFVTAALAVPAVLALLRIGRVSDMAALQPAQPSTPAARPSSVAGDLRAFAGNRALVVLVAAMALFFLANAAMLPLVGSMLTLRSARSPTMLIAACIIVPQIMVAVLSPAVGTLAQRWGRRPLLMIGLAALPLKGICLGLVSAPMLIVAAQSLDGISSAVIGVVVPLIAADMTRGGGRFALAQGVLGTAMGLGAAFSSTIAGVLNDHFNSQVAFLGLSAIAFVALAVALAGMPETRPSRGDRGSSEPISREPSEATPPTISPQSQQTAKL